VGEGAIVGAASVVVKDVAPWQIVVGNPARFIKMRTMMDMPHD
jgi:putative colanic acid biosynthesis acetyltransferase WcaF